MKFFTGWVAAAALALAATAADAQGLANGTARGPIIAVSDFDGPYVSPEAPPPRSGYGAYGYYDDRAPAPAQLPSTEVYAVLRENGFLPLGIPRLRGMVYTIAVIDARGGGDGRLVIDARDGRILRFLPAYGLGMGPAYDDGATAGPYGTQGALPPPTPVRSAVPRPPAPIPHVASRTVPVPKAAPPRGEAPAKVARPASPQTAPQAQAPQAQPPQQAAAVQAKPAEVAPPQAAPTTGQAKPATTVAPSQEMPPVQGLE